MRLFGRKKKNVGTMHIPLEEVGLTVDFEDWAACSSFIKDQKLMTVTGTLEGRQFDLQIDAERRGFMFSSPWTGVATLVEKTPKKMTKNREPIALRSFTNLDAFEATQWLLKTLKKFDRSFNENFNMAFEKLAKGETAV